MSDTTTKKQRMALVFGTLPTPAEIDQFQLIKDDYELSVISTESICGYLSETSRFNNLHCLALPDYDDNPTYIPGLEQVLSKFDIVVVKERIGLYAYQAVKAKWKNAFHLIVWVDNLVSYPAEDVDHMRIIRNEVTNAADAFLVQTKAARKALLVEGIDENKINFIQPWTEVIAERSKKNKSTVLKQLNLAEGSFLIGHMGQIEWEEGISDLVIAAKRAMQKNKDLNKHLYIIFCGVGSYSVQLKQTLKSLGIEDRIKFVAPNRDSYQALLSSANCLFLGSAPSRDRVEGDPFRFVQAMVNEVPIISNRNPLSEEFIGKHRVDFCFGSPESISDALIKAYEAAPLLNNIVKKNVSTANSLFNKEDIANNMKNIFDKYSDVTPAINYSSIDSRVAEVESLIQSENYLKAIDVVDSLFKLENIPVFHKANLYRLIGDSFAKLGDNDQAKTAYMQAVELDAYGFKAYIGLGTISIVTEKYDLAVIHFQKAIGLAPNDEMANLGLGLAFHGLKELDEANKWIVKALEINVENLPAIFSLVKLAYDRDKFEDAEKILNTYLTRKPNDHNIQFTLAGIYFKQANYQRTFDITSKILSEDANNENALALNKQARSLLDQNKAITSNA